MYFINNLFHLNLILNPHNQNKIIVLPVSSNEYCLFPTIWFLSFIDMWCFLNLKFFYNWLNSQNYKIFADFILQYFLFNHLYYIYNQIFKEQYIISIHFIKLQYFNISADFILQKFIFNRLYHIYHQIFEEQYIISIHLINHLNFNPINHSFYYLIYLNWLVDLFIVILQLIKPKYSYFIRWIKLILF